mmetsp:Transcript_19464/g.51154  ORF Transcript_19464/g.51154 Transcript_19464/m.51154 type:complete len:123 (+) Transcript_19464:1225-1593(+)
MSSSIFGGRFFAASPFAASAAMIVRGGRRDLALKAAALARQQTRRRIVARALQAAGWRSTGAMRRAVQLVAAACRVIQGCDKEANQYGCSWGQACLRWCCRRAGQAMLALRCFLALQTLTAR